MAGRIPVCCVVGFPLGAMDTASKAFEAKTAIENGASEVDMVINIGRLKNKEYDAVREDIRAVKQAVGDKILKVIIETCLLTDEEKETMCDIVCEAGADYIKTSTGFSTAGANFHDVELMVKGVHGRCKVKAAGGISTVEDMEKFLALGLTVWAPPARQDPERRAGQGLLIGSCKKGAAEAVPFFLQQKIDKTSINFRELYKKSDTLLDNLTKQ